MNIVKDSEERGKRREELINTFSQYDYETELKLYSPTTAYNLYLNLFDNKIFYDVNLKHIDLYNYNLISEIYNSTISVISELQENNFKVKPLKVELSNRYITIEEGMYTYEQLKSKYEEHLLKDFGIKWNNRTIGKYFPKHIKKNIYVNRNTQMMYIFKKEL